MTMRNAIRRTAFAATAIAAAAAAVTIPATSSSAGLGACGAQQLTARIQKPPVDDPKRPNQFQVILTNNGPDCNTQGFPGVDLTGPNDPAHGPTYSLPRQEAPVQPVTVQHGHAVVSLLTYQPGNWVPDTLVVTPPDTRTQLRVQWPAGVGVLRQDGATHPGTYIGPVAPS